MHNKCIGSFYRQKRQQHGHRPIVGLSFNDLWCWTNGNYIVISSLLCVTDVLAAFVGKRDSNTVTAPFTEWESTERQRFVVLSLRSLHSDLVALMHHRCIGCWYRQQRQQHVHRSILRMSVNGAWTIFCFPFWIIYVLIGCRHPFIRYWQPLLG